MRSENYGCTRLLRALARFGRGERDEAARSEFNIALPALDAALAVASIDNGV